MRVPPKGATAIRYPCVQLAVGSLVTVPSLPRPSPDRFARSRVHIGARSGVTLLELLVVVVVLAASAAVVLPSLRPPAATPAAAENALISATRRTAISRGEPVRLRLDADGAWGVVGARTGTVIDTGRINAHPRAVEVTVDPRGSCTPVASPRTASVPGGLSFDPLACRMKGDSAR